MFLETLNEREIIATLTALGLLLLSAFVFGKLFELIKAPKVVGEILGGMLFGKSCLHHFFPELIDSVFKAFEGQGKVLNIFYQLGLVFLMFSSGFNTRIDLKKKDSRNIGLLLAGSTVLPMLGAIPFAKLFSENYIGSAQSYKAYLLVFVIAAAITSIPVISKIFFDMGIMNTRFSNTVLTVSTFQDLILFILLNVSISIVSSGGAKFSTLIPVVFLTIGVFVAVKILCDRLHNVKFVVDSADFLSLSFISLFFVIALFSRMSVNIMYSSFLIGYVVKSLSELNDNVKERMQTVSNFSFSFFIPIYFALVGIQLNVIHEFSFLRFMLFFTIVFLLEAVGTGALLLLSSYNKRTIINFAITMNARGGPGIVLATTAYAYQIINTEFFTVLIITTMLSSLIAGYWLRFQQKTSSDVFTNLLK
ncbi:MAG TPA: cation:proton antiporter [Clostridia bacterium]|nr:cation:proton antiporter [Clostridia bacterium]